MKESARAHSQVIDLTRTLMVRMVRVSASGGLHVTIHARAIEVSPIVPGRYRNDVKSARQANSIQLFCDSAR
jgi:hypothetical protein